MHPATRAPRLTTLLGLFAALTHAACSDPVATTVASASASESSTTGTTADPPTSGEPTTGTSGEPTTGGSVGTMSTTSVEPTTTDPTTSTSTTTTTTTTTTTDTDTDTDTDSTTGTEVVGRSVSQTVNSGTVATSPNFRMVFTLGQPTQNQGVYTSDNFRLQGGLIGANGNPP